MSNTRKGYTQAITNRSSWKFLGIQIIILSIMGGIYFESTYAFLAMLFCLAILFYFRLTAVLMSIAFALLLALLIPVLISGININKLNASFLILFSTPISQVFVLLVFSITYYLNHSGATVFREALEPSVDSVLKIFTKKRA